MPDLVTTRTGETLVWIAGRLYDAQEFLGGEPPCAHRRGQDPVPNVASAIAPERLAALAEALARLHLSTSGLQPGYSSPLLPERLRSLEAMAEERRKPLMQAAQTRGTGEDRDIALRWLALVPDALDAALGVAGRLPLGEMSEVLCHADLWRAHVRFEDGYFTGFADFESLVLASPALDLAQLVAHFGGRGNTEAVIQSYGTVAPLTGADEAALVPEMVADLAAEGLWALEELSAGSSGLRPAQEASHRLNLRLLLGPLEQAAATCVRSAR
ncbi:hypothetical protein AVDCRST_MAG82-383 [uncultured Rubrobacteraceae bacterium]|uniref:Aminoglycoside phosphotransferase domain-containing protein n=1 Tax=uncultured Rubrobacteraceae bacterium TaxID=349277 RepID=A0A6J4P227_9ACTN|nr:hypothetical protein AVDCRST_MAG82-383 [uncultured Rubrobacteraceae bacterium]